MDRYARLERCSVALLALVVASCGSGSSTPSSSPTPAPTATAQPALAALALGVTGTLTSVNAREWIAAVGRSPAGYDLGTVVLPPDAGPDAGPLPVPGCPLLDPPPGCTATASAMVVGETDWLYGESIFRTPSGFNVPIQEAIGPQGEVIDLVQFATGDLVNDVRPGPGPIFFGTIPFFDTPTATVPKQRPVYWATPGLERVDLPVADFADGPLPLQSDAQQRIAGAGVEPVLPVVWVPVADAYTLTLLPLLDGGARGAALGIADGRIVGWSDDDAAQKHAVVWQLGDQGYAVRTLPIPVQAVGCAQAVGISAARIAGECTDPNGGNLAVVWTSDGGGSFAATRILAPLPSDAVAHVVAISGDLVIGTSSQISTGPKNVVWRLP